LALGGVASGAVVVALASAVVTRPVGDPAPAAMVGLVLAPCAALFVLARPPAAVVAVFLTLPVGLVAVPGLPVQLIQAVVVGVAGLVVVRRLAAGTSLLAWAPPLWWAAGLAAWYLVALPSAVDTGRAHREIVVLFVGVLFASTIVAVCRTSDTVRLVLVVLVGVVAAVAFTTFRGAGQVEAQFGGSVISGRAVGAFGQPNELGTFCAPVGLIAVGLAFASRSARGRVLAVGAALVIVGGLLLSLSRGAWIGFALGALVMVLTVQEARRVLAFLGPPVLVAAMALGAFAPSSPQVEVVGARLKSITGEKNPYDDRPAIWREALRQVTDDPLTGAGPGSFPVISASVTSEARTTFADHAHNIALTVAAEAGLPAMLLLMGLAAHLAVAARRARRAARSGGRHRDAVMIATLASAGVAVLGQGLVDYTLRNAVLFVEVWGVVGVLTAAIRNGGATFERAP
jgi:putative inorganic carbon (HCO3(-)) transporter